MANKEALRSLQQRLASRLQSAQSEADSMAWLAVRVGTGHYLFPLSQSGEIFPTGVVTRVPYTKAWFAGVINLRGGLYGVVDLRRLLEPQARARDDAAGSQTRLVTLNVDLGVNCALMVDALMGLRRPESFASDRPSAEGTPPYLGRCYLDAQGTQWQEVNLVQLSQHGGFLEIGV